MTPSETSRSAPPTPTRLFDLTGKVAVVTGASSGLGVTFAEGLAAAGARVVLAARRRERIEALARTLEGRGSEVLAVECDVASEDSIANLVRQAIAGFGRIDVLVNNAGVAKVQSALAESAEDFRSVLEVNLVGTFLCAQHVGRLMVDQGSGSIINVASVLGLVGAGVIPQASYTASKGAVVNLTRELAAQWARLGVRVNALAPGFFPSEMTAELESDEGKRFIRRRTPMGRGGRPEELLGALLLLASDAGSYMTGQTLVVDGGWTIV